MHVDKAFWRSIVDANFAAPDGYAVATLTTELLARLGSTDPEWRDELAYPILEQWIHRGYYSARDLREVAADMLTNLLRGLGEAGTDSVFLRSFSALILMEIVAFDNELHVLDMAGARTYLEIHAVDVVGVRAYLDAALAYLAGERDLRAYVPEKGWAHAVAHAADLLGALARNRHLAAPDLERILDGIAAKLCERVPHVYLHAEDERLAYAVMGALRRDLLSMGDLLPWLDSLADQPDRRRWTPGDITTDEGACAYANVRAFLRSLYFQLALAANPPALAPELLAAVAGALRALDFGFYALP